MKKIHHGHYTGNRYDLPRATHWYNNRAQGTRVKPTANNVVVLVTNMQGYHQANFGIDPTIGASLEYRHIIKGPTKSI